MSNAMVFAVGLPFGEWSAAIPASAPGPGQGRWLEQLHEQALTLPQAGLALLPLAAALPPRELNLQAVRAWPGASRFPHRLEALAGADERLCWTGDLLLRAWPASRLLVLVEHPATALARLVVQAAGSADVPQALALLESAARSLLRVVERHADECLVVHLGEAIAAPAALKERLSTWLGRPMEWTLSGGERPPVDPPLLVLSARLVASRREVLRLYERLYASCVPLDSAGSDPRLVVDDPDTVESALRRWQALKKEHDRLAKEHDRLAALPQQLSAAKAALDQLRDVSRAELESARQELARSASQSSQAHEQAVAALAQARQQLLESDEERGRWKAQAEQSTRQAAQQQAQRELLIGQLEQVQSELAVHYAARMELEAEARLAQRPERAVGCARVRLGAHRDEDPHRELNALLHEVVAVDRQRKLVQVRLVEHQGRPGLLFFAGPQAAEHPLLAWQPTGTEEGRPFMLVVPSDTQGRQLLQTLGAGDWRFVLGVALRLGMHLGELREAAMRRWSLVAYRLLRELAELPVRFRYDRIEVQAVEAPAQEMQVAFLGASMGGREFGQIRLAWQPNGPGGGLALLAPGAPGERPALAAWPLDERGAWVRRWPVALGQEAPGTGATAFLSLAESDRRVLIDLLEALPAAAALAQQQGVAPAAGPADLQALAQALLHRSRKLHNGSRLSRVWRAVRGRATV